MKKNCYKIMCENKDVIKYSNLGVIASPLGEEIKKALKRFSEFSFIWTADRDAIIKVSC